MKIPIDGLESKIKGNFQRAKGKKKEKERWERSMKFNVRFFFFFLRSGEKRILRVGSY